MNNIVLLPSMKEMLIQKARDAFQAGDYIHTVEHLELLVAHRVESFEVHMNLVVSLMKLKKWKEAIHYAEDFMILYKKEKKSQFIELIVMAFFEQSNFVQALERIDESIGEDLSTDVKQRLKSIRILCHEQNLIVGDSTVDQMIELAEDEKHMELYTTIQMWKQLNIEPPEVFYDFLQQHYIHPVIKTIILEDLQKHIVDREVVVNKFSKRKTVNPNQLACFDQLDYMQELLYSVEEIEHQNPSLYQFIKILVTQYSYVMYPFDIHVNDNDSLSEAFVLLARILSSIEEGDEEISPEVSTHMENIHTCHDLYSSITGDIIDIE